MKAIKVINLSKNYSKKKKAVEAIKNVNIDFEYGKFYLIIGHSGSGKSTLLRLLGLIDRPSSGEIFINDKNVNNLKNKELATIRNKSIGFIFQEFYLDKYLTAIENVTIPALINKENKSKKEVISKSLNLLKNVGLKDRINHYPKELSGGECQRVAIARALVNDAKIILADEPTGNLDIKNEEMIFQKLKDLTKDGKCVIMVSHSKDAKEYADKIINIEEGTIQ